MDSNKIEICRLCFKVSDNDTDNTFAEIGEGIKELVNSLLPSIDLALSNKPLICQCCTENLKECCHYIAFFLGALDTQKNSQREDSEINTVTSLNDCTLCGLCMKLTEYKSFVNLKNDDMDLVDMLKTYFTALDLCFTEEPIICLSCYESLQHIFSFTSKCLSIDERIKHYCIAEEICDKNKVHLGSILNFTSETALKSETDYNNSPAGSAQEIYYVEGQIKSDVTEIKNEDRIGTEEPKLDVEGNKIKIEQGNYFSSQDEISSPVSETKHDLSAKYSSKTIMYKCEICAYESNQSWDYKTHAAAHDFPHEVTLPVSEMKYISDQEHTSEVKKHKCEICAYETIYKWNLKKHMVIHKDPSEITIHSCDLCSFQTKRKDNLQSHMLIHKNPSQVKTYKCDICTHETKRKRNLQSHMLIHSTPLKRYMYSLHRCVFCKYKTNDKYSLKIHLLIHTDPSVGKLYKCEMCKFEAKKQKCLAVHMLTHKVRLQERVHKCNVCSFKTKRKSDFSAHTLTHKNLPEINVHTCDMCTYRTMRKSSLRNHMIVHTSPSKIAFYKCKICMFQTKRKSSLKRHESTHEAL